MTTSKPTSIVNAARSDPIGAGIVVCGVAAVVMGAVWLIEPQWSWPSILSAPKSTPRPLARPPDAWRLSARGDDLLTVPGFPVAYWGRPDAVYGDKVTAEKKPFAGVVVHFTDETPVLRLVRYGHSADLSRGGASYGYHFYIDQAGRVLQGAPLGVRTNHVKPIHAEVRRGAGAHLDGRNAVGVSLIGACKAGLTYRCSAETPTAAQLEAGAAVVKALQFRFNLPCAAVFGHGELQIDRKGFEGITLAKRVRSSCR